MGTKVTLQSAATGTGVSQPVVMNGDDFAVQASIAGTGVLHATVGIEVSNDGAIWHTYAIIVLSESEASDAVSIPGGWNYLRSNIRAISGSGATVNVYLGL